MFCRSIEACISQLSKMPAWNEARSCGRTSPDSFYKSRLASFMRLVIGEEMLSSIDNSVYHLGGDGFSKYAFSNKSTSEFLPPHNVYNDILFNSML